MKVYIIFYSVAALILSICITSLVLMIISLVNIRITDDCNSETCISTGCIYRSCSKGKCVESVVGGCCEDGNCDSVDDDSNYTINIMYVNSIDSIPPSPPSNESNAVNTNGIYIKDGSILNGCLISTGECINELSSSQIKSIYTDNLSSYGDENQYTSIGNDYLRILQDGSFNFLKGSIEIDNVKSTDEVCLINIQSLLENGTISINNLTFSDGILNVTNLIVSGNLFLNNITNIISFNFNDTVEVSGILIQNNTVQGYLNGSYSPLLINPHGGNVGISIGTNNISSNLLSHPLDVSGNIELDSLVLTSNSSLSTDEINYYEEYIFETSFEGPWTNDSTTQQIYITRIADMIQMTFNEKYIDFCNGTNIYIRSVDAIPSRFVNNSTNIVQPARVIDDSSNVMGTIIIDISGNFKVTTLNSLGHFEGEGGSYCGYEANSIIWML